MSGGAWKQNGIIQQAIRYVRSQVCELKFDKFKINCTLVQLYKSHLVDLFRRDDQLVKALSIKVNPSGEVFIEGASVIERINFIRNASAAEDLIETFNNGLDNRLMRATDINEASSRSHLIFTMSFEATKG